MTLVPLEQIATGGTPPVDISQLNKQVAETKLRDSAQKYKSMYRDPAQAHRAWIVENQATPENRQTYWEIEHELNPSDGAEALIDRIESDLNGIPSDEGKSWYLRDKLSTLPDYAQEMFGGRLFHHANRAMKQNEFKSKTVFRDDYRRQISQVMTTGMLDPDVASSAHKRDAQILAAADLTGVSRIVEGRLMVTDKKGNFIPAYMNPSRDQVLNSDDFGESSIPEKLMVAQITDDIIESSIEQNLRLARQAVEDGNFLVSQETKSKLSSGDIPPHQWGEASLVVQADRDEFTEIATRGWVDAHPTKSEIEVDQLLYGVVKDFYLGDINA